MPRPAPSRCEPPARLRLHPGGPARAARADGRRPGRADRLDGQRPRAGGALRSPALAVHLLQAAVRPGDQPADRPDPRADRDEPDHRHRRPRKPLRRGARARQPAGHQPADPPRRRAREAAPRRPHRLPRAHDRHHLARRRRPGRHGERAAARLRRGPREHRRGRHDPDPLRPRRRRRARADPVAAGRRRRPPAPRARGHAPARRPGRRVRRAARGPPHRDADRLRRRRGQPVPDARIAGRPRRDGPHARRDGRQREREAPGQGDRQGPAEDDLEDGHLDDPVLLRRADLRGGRPRRRPRRPVLHRHAVAHRRHRRRDARARGARPPRARLRPQPRARPAAGRRRLPLAPRRRAPRLEPDDRRTLQNAVGLNPDAEPGPVSYEEFADAVNDEAAGRRRCAACWTSSPPAARSRSTRSSRQRDRQALLDRRDEPRLDLARGARDAGDRDEPPRRRSNTGEGGEDPERFDPNGDRAARRSSRSPPAASA